MKVRLKAKHISYIILKSSRTQIINRITVIITDLITVKITDQDSHISKTLLQ